ncbi:MAG: hypothetical protein JGK38_05075 [Microcoleus sp. PH2017_15_JOR_U_A]|nr:MULTISPECIES: hypothetical protein [unclassified Microcoleus]MCC3496028.1 hypothetical protein [Microcoleus sp. PH2017_15_JOR_U_A]MCC3596774.1 hypothetical protein [Microcoleus sp. PH2017_26_ELK_O_A]MCC3621754.1 hypothetical protein [Microcoleus sp. PH2017_36_ELK_O_B]
MAQTNISSTAKAKTILSTASVAMTSSKATQEQTDFLANSATTLSTAVLKMTPSKVATVTTFWMVVIIMTVCSDKSVMIRLSATGAMT